MCCASFFQVIQTKRLHTRFLITMFYALMITLCLSGSALAQVPYRGRCPPINGLSDLDINKFGGNWYEVERYFALFEITGKCNIVEFGPGANGTVELVNAHVSQVTGEVVPVYVTLLPNDENPEIMYGKLPFTPYNLMSQCWFLGTDYDTYSVNYCCTDYGVEHLRYAWIITRDRFPRKSVLRKAYKALTKNNLETKPLWKTEQHNC